VTDHRELVLTRIDYLQAELTALAALLRVGDLAPSTPAQPTTVDGRGGLERATARMAVEDRAPESEDLPPEPVAKARASRRGPAPSTIDPLDFTIDPGRAATLLGVTRQTVDRRLHDGVPENLRGRPHNVGRGGVRARWRWRSEADVRAWWAAVR
jgi:hypothetical protein